MESLNYTLVLSLQSVLLLYDIVINSSIDLINPENVIQLVLFILQDICIIFQLIVLFLELFNTSTFQAGFVSVMLKKFRLCILVTALYLCISIALHVWTLSIRWNDPLAYLWGSGGFYTVYILQRIVSPFYYYTYKRTALRLADPRFYRSTDWLRNHLTIG